MPCFKGLAVSVHTPDGPISEYSIQKQARASRITSYVPVPPAKIPPESKTGKPEQSTFAISITLLTPGQQVPYSTPKSTPDNPYPKARTVGPAPGFPGGSSKETLVPPYIPRTTSPNETIAAYIYFDGRAKEEVATLLRKGEETWVNSRWVSVPDSEGGGLAEREFLFREVGLERWLNGLDLEGKDKAEKIQRRQRRLEKKRQKKKELDMDSDDDLDSMRTRRANRNAVLRYGGENGSPVEDLANDESLFSSDSDSEDEGPKPEAAGQIKVALYRVLASGEVKRGEYSPQFGAHDDDDNMESGKGEGDEEVDHTTSFAKPKTLDPKTISTQTVTGLDPPEQPYAVFTFFYRGAKQLQKMGILPTPEGEKIVTPAKPKASGPDFSKFGPLKSHGTVGFTGYRDGAEGKRKQKSRDVDAMDSDADDDDDETNVKKVPEGEDEADVKNTNGNQLSPEDARRQGEVVDGVQKMKLKRQHSAEPINEPSSTRKSPHIKAEDSPAGTPRSINSTHANAGTPPPENATTLDAETSETIGSPYKRHRSSVPGLNGFTASETANNLDSAATSITGAAFGGPLPKVEGETSLLPAVTFSGNTDSTDPAAAAASASRSIQTKTKDEDEEL